MRLLMKRHKALSWPQKCRHNVSYAQCSECQSDEIISSGCDLLLDSVFNEDSHILELLPGDTTNKWTELGNSRVREDSVEFGRCEMTSVVWDG